MMSDAAFTAEMKRLNLAYKERKEEIEDLRNMEVEVVIPREVIDALLRKSDCDHVWTIIGIAENKMRCRKCKIMGSIAPFGEIVPTPEE